MTERVLTVPPSVDRPPSAGTPTSLPRPVFAYIAVVGAAALAAGGLSWGLRPTPDPAPLFLLCALGALSVNLREPDVGSLIGFSFLSIVLLASAAIVGPFGAWVIGLVAFGVDVRRTRWVERVFNMAMCSIIGAAGAWAYVLAGGATQIDQLRGAAALAVGVGLPLMVADIVGCVTNAVLLSGVMHVHHRVSFSGLVRRLLTTSGLAYVGYGVIGFLFVILWFPAQLGAFSAVLVLVPLLAARWAFIQYGEELRSHERTIETLVTALETRSPEAAARSRRTARLAEWIAEELALAPSQVGTVRYAAILHEIGHLGVPTRLLRQPPESLDAVQRQLVDRHCVMGAQMIAGIDFLEPARSGIHHQNERFDGSGGPDGLAGVDIPIAARIVAVAARLSELTTGARGRPGRAPADGVRLLEHESGRYDPAVLVAARTVLDRHHLAVSIGGLD